MSARSALLVVDSFTDGSFAVENRSGPLTTLINNPFADKRGALSGGDTDFFISQNAILGTFTYRVAFRGEPNPNGPPHVDLLYYKNNGALDLVGIDKAVIRISSLVGLGEIKLYFNQSSDSPVYAIPSAGDLQIPLPHLPPGGAGNPVGSFTVQINALSSDSAITLDEITLIPEPGSVTLCIAGASLLAVRRRTSQARLRLPA